MPNTARKNGIMNRVGRMGTYTYRRAIQTPEWEEFRKACITLQIHNTLYVMYILHVHVVLKGDDCTTR